MRLRIEKIMLVGFGTAAAILLLLFFQGFTHHRDYFYIGLYSFVWVVLAVVFLGVRHISRMYEQSHKELIGSQMELGKSEARLKAIMETAADGIISLNEQGVVLSFNPAATRIFGYRSDEVIGSNVTMLIPELIAFANSGLLVRNTGTEENKRIDIGCEVEGRHKDGSAIPLCLAMSSVNQGDERLFVSIVRGSSGRKQVEETLPQSSAWLAEAQSVAHIGSWEFDLITRQNYWSDEMFRLLDFDPEQGAPSYDHLLARYHPDDVPMHNRIIRQAIQNGDSFEYDIRAIMNDHSIRWFQAIGKAIWDENGCPVRLFGTLIDISQRKADENLLQDMKEGLEEANEQLVFQQAELEDANEQLEALATTDGLTGIKNHRTFQVRVREEFDRALRYGAPLSLLLLDVDHFKQFNDMFGHPAGDQVLKKVAEVLQSTSRAADFVARYGGEEFVVLLPETGAADAIEAAERIRAAISVQAWEQRGITVSIGVSSLHTMTVSIAVLIDEADKALYMSKDAGRNRVTHYRPETIALSA